MNVLDLQSGDFTHYRHDPLREDSIPHDIVRDIARDPSGDLWLATHGGLSRFNPKTEHFTNYFHDPQDPQSLSVNVFWRVHVDREGMVWAASRSELNRLDPATGSVRRFQPNASEPGSLPEDWLFAIHEDRQGTLWFGASRFDRATETFRSYAPAAGQAAPISNAFVMTIAEDRDGYLWFGTRGGLNRLDDAESGRFTAYTSADGLPNDVIYGILFDDTNALWLSTNRGLARLDPRTGAVDQFDVSHGLQANEFNNGAYYRAESGEMYFGGINGFNVFRPDEIRPKDYEPPLVITRFVVANQDRLPGLAQAQMPSVHVLSSQENNVSFEFAALDYSAPQRIRYQYRLHGVDDSWINAGYRRFASYTHLAPGDYRFEVRGTNSDGLWSSRTAILPFRVTPALWQRGWFRLCLALLLLVAVGMIYRYQTLRVRHRNLALQALVAERTTKLEQANAKLHIEIRQREIAEEEIRKVAYHDYLTGLPNRRLFASLCEKALASAAREGQHGALFFVDVDGFKAINDELGHEAGDAALVSIAGRIRSVIRESDVACRMGGDEFVLLMKGVADRDAATHVAQKLLAVVAAPRGADAGEDLLPQSISIGVSIGVCLYPDEGLDLETLLSRADQAMYVAKKTGATYSFWQDLNR